MVGSCRHCQNDQEIWATSDLCSPRVEDPQRQLPFSTSSARAYGTVVRPSDRYIRVVSISESLDLVELSHCVFPLLLPSVHAVL